MTDTTETTAPEQGWRDDLRRLLRSSTFVVGALIVLFWIGCAVFGPSLVPHDPFADDLINSLMPPSFEHWFGTDQLGRDVFSRVIVGARDILTVAPIATLLSTILGTALGLTMGYFGGLVDEVLSRLVDAVLALPTVIVALLALTALGTSTTTVLFVIAFSFAPIIARTVRSAVLGEVGLAMLGVWTKADGAKVFRYIGQLWKYLQIHKSQLQRDRTILLGDFNSNRIWDKPDRWWNHSDVVEELEGIGLRSVYHTQTVELQGQEATPTFFLQRNEDKSYHIDYVFVSDDLLPQCRIQIGSKIDWLKISDHMPVCVEIKI